MPYHKDTQIPIHPAISLKNAQEWKAPENWNTPENTWLPTDDWLLEPVEILKEKRAQPNTFSTLGAYSLYHENKKYIYEGVATKNKVKFCINQDGKWMVVKINTFEKNALFLQYAKREAHFLRHLNRLHAFYQRTLPNGKIKYYLVMDWIEGVQLSKVKVQKLSFLEKLQEAKAILQSLISLNAMGILHQDIHSGNLIRRPDGEYVWIDFEMAHHVHPDQADDLFGFDEMIYEVFFSDDGMTIIHEQRQAVIDSKGYSSDNALLTPIQKREVYLEAFEEMIRERLNFITPQ